MNNKINPINDFRDAKIGDPVTSVRFGKGIIEEHTYAACRVRYDTKLVSYYNDGYYNRSDNAPDLYKGHGHFNILFLPDIIEEIPVIDKSKYRPYTKFVDLTGRKVISNNNETRLILESNRNGTYTLPEGNYDAQFLFYYFTFEDGTYCGELKEDNV